MTVPHKNSSETQRRPAFELVVDDLRAGQRIDNFLARELKSLPRARIYRILRRGEVRVNKGRVRQHYRLQLGDVVRIPPLADAPAGVGDAPGAAVLRRIARSVLYEDADLMIIDKPAGIAVHGGSGRSYGVIEALRVLRPEQRMLELVHRLDRDTSGCLMIAKRRATLIALHGALRAGRVAKSYLCLVKGTLHDREQRIDAPLRKNVLRSGERMVHLDAGGKAATTVFTRVGAGGGGSLVAARPLTGRTHQIRVHAAAIGHPIAGDAKYGAREFNRLARGKGLSRLYLHAHALSFEHPASRARLEVNSPPSVELVDVAKRFGIAGAELDRVSGRSSRRARPERVG